MKRSEVKQEVVKALLAILSDDLSDNTDKFEAVRLLMQIDQDHK